MAFDWRPPAGECTHFSAAKSDLGAVADRRCGIRNTGHARLKSGEMVARRMRVAARGRPLFAISLPSAEVVITAEVRSFIDKSITCTKGNTAHHPLSCMDTMRCAGGHFKPIGAALCQSEPIRNCCGRWSLAPVTRPRSGQELVLEPPPTACSGICL